MHNIGVGGDFFDLKWTFLNRPISKLKYEKNACNFSLKGY
jgi:hypothetical protein